MEMEHFVKMIGSPTGIPGSARGGEKMGAAWRPRPGLAQTGLSGENKMDSRKTGIHFLSPLSILFFPGEEWVHINERLVNPGRHCRWFQEYRIISSDTDSAGATNIAR